ncbi:MAG: MgtC/SapB family protein [Candidatus Aenigmatarchaeota archaeon]
MQELLIKIIIALALGALVGIEREKRLGGKVFAGFRTFMLVCLFGLLSSYLSSYFPFVLPFSLLGILALASLNFYRKVNYKRQRGITTELAFFITFFIGTILYFENYPYILSIALTLLLTLILVLKESLHEFAHKITVKEIEDFIIFGLVAFVIYPILPSTPLDPFKILDLRFIWKALIFIFGLSFLVYSIFRILKQRGLLISGILGGLINSIYMSNFFSSNFSKYEYSKSGIIASVSSMLLRCFILVSTIYPSFYKEVIFLPLTTFSGYLISYILKKENKEKIKIILTSPISFKFTFLYVIFFSALFFIANFLFKTFGSNILFLMTGIIGLIDVSTMSVTLPLLVKDEALKVSLLILTSLNIVGNSLFVLKNSKKLFFKVIRYLAILILLNFFFFLLF